MRIKETKVYKYDELNDRAKQRAREWFAQDYPEYNWWDHVYEDIVERTKELGIDLKQKPVRLMGGGTRYDHEIYFTGFYHQGQGSSFSGVWHAMDMKLDKLRENCPTESELHRIGETLTKVAKEDPDITASIAATTDTWITVETSDGEAIKDRLNELTYESPEYNALMEQCRERDETIREAMRDFNHWVFSQLKKEYEWLTSDEQIEETIRINQYEFTEDGEQA